MKKLIAAMSATSLLALAACAEPAEDEVTDEDTVVLEDDGTPMADEGTTIVNEAPDTPTADGVEGDSVSISEDGVRADINDGDTSVNADLSDNPSVELEVE